LLVFLAVFAGCGAVVFVISVFGTQTETFEEALEKQRNAKEKSKEKKKVDKKSAPEKKKKQKKGKEAKNNNIQELVEESVLVDPAGQVVEPVYIEPVKEQVSEPAPVKQTEYKENVEPTKPKKEVKKKEEKVVEKVEVVVPEPVVEEVAVESCAEVVDTAVEVDNAEAEVVEAVVDSPPEPVVVVEQPVEKPAEKKKMVIQEVAEIVEEPVDEKKSKKKNNKTKKKSHYEEVLETVRRITLSDTEAQGIVDVVLMKQTGHKDDGDGEDWVEPGKQSDAQKKSRHLAELTEQLEEEKSKSSGLEKKMLTLRKEMNDSRGQLNVVKRELEEMNTKKTQETGRLNTTIQQLKGDLNTSKTYNIQMESKYQTEIRTIKEQLERATQAPAASDGHLVTENEQLKAANAELTSTNSSLHQKFTQKCFEVDSITASLATANEEKQNLTSQLAQAQEDKQAAEEKQTLTTQLSQAVEEKQSLSTQLSQAVEEKQSLATQLSQAIEAQNRLSEELKQALDKEVVVRSEADGNSQEAVVAAQELETQLSGAKAVQQQLQSDLTSVKDKLSEKEKENARLMEENERLSEQVASSVERPAAEGEEAVNGHTEVEIQKEVVAVSTDEDWQQKFEKLAIQLEERSQQCNSQELELTESKQQINNLKTKNDELSSEFEEYKKECMLMLGNVLPAHCTEQQDFPSIQSNTKKFIQDLESAAADTSKIDALNEENQKLEAQGATYKTVLAETENILNTLQASVEGAELEWKKKLEASQSECAEIKSKVSELQSSNQQLLDKIMDQECISNELEIERIASDGLSRKCSELQQLIAIGEKALQLAHSQDSSMTNGAEQTEEEA